MAQALSRVKYFNSGMDFTTLPHFLLCFRHVCPYTAERTGHWNLIALLVCGFVFPTGNRSLTVAAQQVSFQSREVVSRH